MESILLSTLAVAVMALIFGGFKATLSGMMTMAHSAAKSLWCALKAMLATTVGMVLVLSLAEKFYSSLLPFLSPKETPVLLIAYWIFGAYALEATVAGGRKVYSKLLWGSSSFSNRLLWCFTKASPTGAVPKTSADQHGTKATPQPAQTGNKKGKRKPQKARAATQLSSIDITHVKPQAKQPTTPPGKVTPKHPFLSSSDSSDGSTSEWEQVSRAGKHRGSGKKAKAALQAKAPDVHSKPHTVTKNPDFNHIAAQKKAAPSVHASQAASSAPSNDNTHIPSNAIPYDCATWEKVGRNRNRKKILQKATSNSAVQKTASIATELPPKSSNLPFKASKNKQRRPEANTAKNAAPASIGQGAVRMPLVSLLMPMTYLWERSRKPDGSLPVGYSDMAKAYPKLSGFRTTRGDGNCAYRSVMFGLVEAAFCSSKVRKEISKRLAELNSIVPLWVLYHHVSRNCTSPAVDGYKLLKELVENEKGRTLNEMLHVCNEQQASDSIVLYLRALTATGMLQMNQSEWWRFTLDLPTHVAEKALARGVRHICEEFVLGLPPQNRQDPKWRWHWADEGNLAALSQMLKIQLHIFSVTPVSFNVAKYQPDDTNVVIGLLHHGGHYDVLFV